MKQPQKIFASVSVRPGEAFPIQRLRLDVRGRVQGVGFRPFVYRLASELELAGFVGNDMRGAFIEIQGAASTLQQFQARLKAELPALASISEIAITQLPLDGGKDFFIQSSQGQGVQQAEITPDAATCQDCLRELLDPNDRRYRYPFINCTNCGPRYSIIRAVPYDRPNTTMSAFTMCADCQREYDDPASRRFHAQPNACPVCGPRLWLVDARGEPIEGEAVTACAKLLLDGRIVAIKGLGGFHLACRADRDEAVGELRRRKGRETKPLAIMVDGLDMAKELAEVDDSSAAVMRSPARPIVLLTARVGAQPGAAVPHKPRAAVPHISRHVAPGLRHAGHHAAVHAAAHAAV